MEQTLAIPGLLILITDFADDAVIFAESLEVLVSALEAVHEDAKPLGLQVSCIKTKVKVFGDLLDLKHF